jgi:hypothetical protein
MMQQIIGVFLLSGFMSSFQLIMKHGTEQHLTATVMIGWAIGTLIYMFFISLCLAIFYMVTGRMF